MKYLTNVSALLSLFTLTGCVAPLEQASRAPEQPAPKGSRVVAEATPTSCQYDEYGAPILTYKAANGRQMINRACLR